jgi:hypothetical protein
MSKIEQVWTKREFENARKWWIAGLTADEIGAKLGRSRGSVLGKIKRLGVQREAPRRQVVKRETVKAAPPPAPPEPVVVEKVPANPALLENLGRHGCRAILGDVGTADTTLYCNDPKAGGSSYCEFHTSRFTQPPNPKVKQWPNRRTRPINTTRWS